MFLSSKEWIRLPESRVHRRLGVQIFQMRGMHLEARGSRWMESNQSIRGTQEQQITMVSEVELTTSLEFKSLMLLQWQLAVDIQTKEHLAGLLTDNLTL
jgi:hypothetical protein